MSLGPKDFRIHVQVMARSGSYADSQLNLTHMHDFVVSGDAARLGRFLEEAKDAIAEVVERYAPSEGQT